MLRTILISTFLFLGALSLKGQNPAHFIIGQEDFSGKDIYSIIQDRFDNYWIGTDYGIYKYDGYEFKFIPCEEMLSHSVFNLKEDSKGRIYCHNLGGQIFQIENDICIVYYEIPHDIVKPEINYALDLNDNLYIESNNIYILNKETKEIDITYELRRGTSSKQMMTDNEGIVHFFFLELKTFYDVQIVDGKVIEHAYAVPEQLELMNRFHSFQKNDSIKFYTESLSTLFEIRGDSLKQINTFNKEISRSKILYTGDLWITDVSSHTFKLDNSYHIINKDNQLLNSYAISSALRDREENTLFGTFSNGIVVVPKTDIFDISIKSTDGLVNKLTIGPDESMVYATSTGKIVQLKNNEEVKRFDTKKFGRIEFLHYLPVTDELLYFQRGTFTINLTTGEKKPASLSSLKNISEIYPNEYLLSTNIGVQYLNFSDTPQFPRQNENENTNSILVYNNRSKSACYDTENNITFIGTATGLQIEQNKELKQVNLGGNQVYANDMIYHKGSVYITTNHNGLLIFRNGKLVDNWHENRNGTSSKLRHVKPWKDHIIVSSERGIRVFDEIGQTKALINESEGLYSNQINDFEILKDTLWMLHQKGVQTIALHDFKPSHFKPTINIEAVLVNDIPLDSSEKNNLNYYQNKITFNVSALSLRYGADISYQYRLIGVDENWQHNTYRENKISYKTLPPDKYTFELLSVYNGNKSKTLRYSFEIHQAFWNTWWFLTTSLLLIFILFFSILLYFIKRQKRKATYKNEINGLKLTAIQAQMNPHFIFNSLNSIQDLVLKNDAENAYNYISKFALLVRNTLNHSKKDFINLETELESIDLYLTLEKLRFKKNFEYIINNHIDDQIIIPPLLIQPFIENAIIHGLIHKTGDKLVEVTFKFDDGLICIIKDNGIGREASKKIKLRQRKDHESFAVEAIKKRLEILKDHYGGTFEIIYTNIEQGKERGTIVQIKLPYKSDY